jgi:hypothetical protein
MIGGFYFDGTAMLTLKIVCWQGATPERATDSLSLAGKTRELIMPARARSLLVPESILWPVLVIGVLLFASANPLLAQDSVVTTSENKPNPLYPDDAEITFQWNYECPSNKPCTFVCRGAGGAGGSDHVIRLDIYLGTLPLNGVQQERAAAIFYDFSSREFPHSAGFAISTGINSLSCQVNGLNLKYSGPPPNKSKPDAKENVPVSSATQ